MCEFGSSQTHERPRMEDSTYPPGWDEDRVRRVMARHEQQSEEEAVAEDEAAFEDETQALVEVPKELVPAVRDLRQIRTEPKGQCLARPNAFLAGHRHAGRPPRRQACRRHRHPRMHLHPDPPRQRPDRQRHHPPRPASGQVAAVSRAVSSKEYFLHSTVFTVDKLLVNQ